MSVFMRQCMILATTSDTRVVKSQTPKNNIGRTIIIGTTIRRNRRVRVVKQIMQIRRTRRTDFHQIQAIQIKTQK